MSDERGIDRDEERHTMVAEYVLGLLGPEAHRRAERLIEADPRLMAERDFWTARFSSFDADYDEAAPPSRVIERIESRLFGAERKASWFDNLMLWRGLAAGALAVAILAVGINVLEPRQDVSTLTTQLVAALQAEGSDVQFVALYDGAGTVRLTALSGEPVDDRDLELWAIQGGGNPISMGVIPVNQRSSVPLSENVLSGWGEGSVLAITLEPKGGAPAGVPTGPIVASGEVHQI
ncbi:anti-sigma factor [Devosia aurantiaca]|uniref:Anti-sigma factor n=1 Tax=Devosia aurantiaca TaxID=2714858 RepID=A0A6M1T0M8_9HYPH|nr:anti-sigma factor [Devosia aurantiaca]NGP18441.1 anti-sigma factor [Devosia aurantiaca]